MRKYKIHFATGFASVRSGTGFVIFYPLCFGEKVVFWDIPYATKPEKVTCKNCLRMLRKGDGKVEKDDVENEIERVEYVGRKE